MDQKCSLKKLSKAFFEAKYFSLHLLEDLEGCVHCRYGQQIRICCRYHQQIGPFSACSGCYQDGIAQPQLYETCFASRRGSFSLGASDTCPARSLWRSSMTHMGLLSLEQWPQHSSLQPPGSCTYRWEGKSCLSLISSEVLLKQKPSPRSGVISEPCTAVVLNCQPHWCSPPTWGLCPGNSCIWPGERQPTDCLAGIPNKQKQSSVLSCSPSHRPSSLGLVSIPEVPEPLGQSRGLDPREGLPLKRVQKRSLTFSHVSACPEHRSSDLNLPHHLGERKKHPEVFVRCSSLKSVTQTAPYRTSAAWKWETTTCLHPYP